MQPCWELVKSIELAGELVRKSSGVRVECLVLSTHGFRCIAKQVFPSASYKRPNWVFCQMLDADGDPELSKSICEAWGFDPDPSEDTILLDMDECLVPPVQDYHRAAQAIVRK